MSQAMADYVMGICMAYEEGYAAAEHGLAAIHNNYKEETEQYYAWHFGHTNSLTVKMLGDEEFQIEVELEN